MIFSTLFGVLNSLEIEKPGDLGRKLVFGIDDTWKNLALALSKFLLLVLFYIIMTMNLKVHLLWYHLPQVVFINTRLIHETKFELRFWKSSTHARGLRW